MSRWIVNDCAVHPAPLIVRHGIPQGDPAVPVVMNLLMFALMRRVEQKLSLLEGATLFSWRQCVGGLSNSTING